MKYQFKNGIAMIMAVMVIILTATIMALGLAMTTKTTNENLDMYLSEQAEILADSAREYVMYKIGNTPCIESGYTFLQDDFYIINISIKYVTPEGCVATPDLNYISASNPNHLDANLITSAAIIDVKVSIDKSKTSTNESISFHKRYIELIKIR